MVFKAASAMFASQLLATLVLFLRNIILARLISVEDFGIASTFAILFALLETATNVSVNRLIVQDPNGEDPRFQNTLQSFQVLRGFISTLVMLGLAYPYAAFMKTPDLVWAYQMLAIIPFVRGFEHLDIFRLQRQMKFMPFAITMVLSPIGGLITVFVVYLFRPDYQTMLWSIIIQQCLEVLVSHLVAQRRFGLDWDMGFVRRSLKFGVPLLLNSMLLFVVINGDRVIIANQINLIVLAWFSAAFLLANTPTRVMSNTSSSVFLPRLSACQEDRPAFQKLSLVAVEVNLFLGLLVAVGLSLAGPLLLVGLFGEPYAPGLEVLVVLGLMQAARIARTGPNAIAMASGRTPLLLYANIVRVMGLPAAYVALLLGGTVMSMMAIALIAEVAALVFGMVQVSQRLQVSLRPSAPAFVAFLAVLALVLGDMIAVPPSSDILGSLHWFQLVLLGSLAAAFLAMPHMRRGALGLLRRPTRPQAVQ